MLLKNACIYTMDKDIIENGYIKIKDGVITQTGDMANIPQPENGEEQLDLTGKIITPGFIDAHTHLGIIGDGIGFEAEDVNEDSDPSTPHLRALDAVNPLDNCFNEALRSGVTTAAVSPGSTNPVAGQISVLKTYGSCVDDSIIKENAGTKFALGENPKMTYYEKSETPTSRMATAAIIREQLYKAQRYLSDTEKADDEDNSLPEYDIKCEALIPLLNGETKAHFHAHKAYDILTAVRICREFKLDYAIIHCTEGHLIAEKLAGLNTEIICGPIIGSRSKPELANMSLQNASVLNAKGLEVCISTDHPEVPLNFLLTSAMIAFEDDFCKAVEAVTVNAAKLLGIEDKVGMVKPGLDADLLVFDKNINRTYNLPEKVFVNGRLV